MFNAGLLGKFFGVELRIHWSFYLLLGWVAVVPLVAGSGAAFAIEQALLLMTLFTIVLCHEFGHVFAARYFGIKTRDVTLLPIGGVARLQRIPREPLQELVVALAGPAVNVAIAILLLPFVQMPVLYSEGIVATIASMDFLTTVFWMNASMTLFNLLPAFPLDGGRVLRALLASILSYSRATNIAAGVGVFMAVVLAVLGVTMFNPLLVLVAVFIGVGAMQEAGSVKVRSTLEGARVSDAMLSRFDVLGPDEDLRRAAGLILKGSQKEFPVVEDGQIVGVLSRGQIVQSASANGFDTRVASAMTRAVLVAKPGEELDAVLARVPSGEELIVPVVSDGQLVGLLTSENISEFVSLRNAMNANNNNGRGPWTSWEPRVRKPVTA
jgi:Zn-dependent protease